MPDYVHRYTVTLTGSSLFHDEVDKIMADFVARCKASSIAADIERNDGVDS
jgi:hypothetical protein